MQEKSREVAVRRTAARRGYTAFKSRRRDPLATDYGMWTVTGPRSKRVSPPSGWTLQQVEQWLTSQGRDHDGTH